MVGRRALPTVTEDDMASFEEFLDGATGERGDSRQDRLVSLFVHARHSVTSSDWHRRKGVRDFSRTYPDENPYIPASVRLREFAGRGARYDYLPFPDDWQAMGGVLDPLVIHASDVAGAIELSSEIGQAFVVNNLHTDAYFFTKFIEWFITLVQIEQTGARSLIDLGAAYPGFARLATRLFPDLEVTMLDIAFPPKKREIDRRIFEFGADAGDLVGIEDNSVDLICSHNAFEHFSGDSDRRCIREIARVLAPGGRAVITPFMAGRCHAVTINPFACFTLMEDAELHRDILDEIEADDCFVRYNHEIISPYARVYSAKSAHERLFSEDLGLDVSLRPVSFADEGFDEDGMYSQPILGKTLQRNILDRAHFQTLELTKRVG